MNTIFELNNANHDDATAMILPFIERSPNLAKKVAMRRPFLSAKDLSHAIFNELLTLSKTEKLELFNAHPELAMDNPLSMTAASQLEQGLFDLTCEHNPNREKLITLNARYQKKFGFPFITALIRHADLKSVIKEFEERLNRDFKSEVEAAIEQVSAVSEARVKTFFESHSAVNTHITPENSEETHEFKK